MGDHFADTAHGECFATTGDWNLTKGASAATSWARMLVAEAPLSWSS